MYELEFNINFNKSSTGMADIQCVFESINSTGSIYISNFIAAESRQILQKRGIKAIVSIARRGYVKHKKQDVAHYLYIPAEDHEEYQIIQHFEDTFQFIEKARKSTNVLVHCIAGVSRSVTIVLAYLLKKYKYSLGNIFSMIRRKRRKINPNPGFIEQLKTYSMKLGIKQDSIVYENITTRQSSRSKFKRQLMAKSQEKPSFHVKEKENSPDKNLGKNIFPSSAEKKQQIFNSYTPKKIKKIKSFSENIKEQLTEDLQLLNLPEEIPLKKHITSPQKRSSNIQQKIMKIRQKMFRDNSFVQRKNENSFYKPRQNKSLSRNDKSESKQKNNEQNSARNMKTAATFNDSLCLNKQKRFQQTRNDKSSLELSLRPIQIKQSDLSFELRLQSNKKDKYTFSRKNAKVYF